MIESVFFVTSTSVTKLVIHLGTPYTYTYLPLYQAGAASAQRRAWVRGCPYTCTLSITQCQIVQNTHSTCFIKSKNADKTLLWVSFTTSGHYYSKFISWCFVLYDVSPPPPSNDDGGIWSMLQASGPVIICKKKEQTRYLYVQSKRQRALIDNTKQGLLSAHSRLSDERWRWGDKSKTKNLCVSHLAILMVTLSKSFSKRITH